MNALLAVEDIIEDLSDRRGLGHEWGSIDEDIQTEIQAKWTAIVEARITAAVAAEREACAQLAADELTTLMGRATESIQLGSVRYRIKRIAAAIRARGAQ